MWHPSLSIATHARRYSISKSSHLRIGRGRGYCSCVCPGGLMARRSCLVSTLIASGFVLCLSQACRRASHRFPYCESLLQWWFRSAAGQWFGVVSSVTSSLSLHSPTPLNRDPTYLRQRAPSRLPEAITQLELQSSAFALTRLFRYWQLITGYPLCYPSHAHEVHLYTLSGVKCLWRGLAPALSRWCRGCGGGMAGLLSPSREQHQGFVLSIGGGFHLLQSRLSRRGLGFGTRIWWGIGDNAYAPQPIDMRLYWKIHATSTSNHHHQPPFNLRLCWKNPHPQHVKPLPPATFFTCVCVGNATPPACQTTTKCNLRLACVLENPHHQHVKTPPPANYRHALVLENPHHQHVKPPPAAPPFRPSLYWSVKTIKGCKVEGPMY